MNLDLKITDERHPVMQWQYADRNRKPEPYDRVALTLDADPAVVADTLRAIADDLSPVRPSLAEMADAMVKSQAGEVA